jgi:hypothetical protein
MNQSLINLTVNTEERYLAVRLEAVEGLSRKGHCRVRLSECQAISWANW